VPTSTIIVTLYFQFPPGIVTCADVDAAAAAGAVLQAAQALAGSTGRAFSAGGAAACSDKPVPAGAAGRHLLQATQAVVVVPVKSAGPVPPGDAAAAANDLAKTVQSTVQASLVVVVQAAVNKPGYDAAAVARQMDTKLAQIELEGQELLYSPPPPAPVAAGRCHLAAAPTCLRLPPVTNNGAAMQWCGWDGWQCQGWWPDPAEA
jgi:hypothetical protein